ncbi:MAG: glycosyltransferase [Bacilli bacterium]|nr:glycosyltransferase [Bacilli bacterium]
MTKVLIFTSGLSAGGVDNLILNTLNYLDKEKFSIDILVYNTANKEWQYKFEDFGCKILEMESPRKIGVFKAIKIFKTIFDEGNYDIVHAHNGFSNILPVIAASKTKKTKIIIHSHFDNYQNVRGLTKRTGRLVFKMFPCIKLACSNGAGKELYGKHASFLFVKNGIDAKKFSFNEQTRLDKRKELKIEHDDFAVCTVGRMQYQKNHEFLIRVFDEIHKVKPCSKLFLIGDGELRPSIEDQVESLGLSNNVVFLGVRSDVNELLCAMDCFIMPTRFEGLSLALLEVQCSGVPCLTSDVVPLEAKVADNFEFLSLGAGEKVWADRALSYYKANRQDGYQTILDNGFDKSQSARTWYQIYENVANSADKRCKSIYEDKI